MKSCRHVPACPTSTTSFACGQRTLTEDAVNRGLITRDAARSLLAKYHVPMTPPSKVYTGAVETAVQGKLHVDAVSVHVARVDQLLKHRKF